MKITISNIAWQAAEENQMADLLADMRVNAVEVAPTKSWPKPLEATEKQARTYREGWEKRGISLVAMQSLLFGRPDLAIFGSADKRKETLDYLKGILQLGGWLGVQVVVFGSPKNRKREGRSHAEAAAIAKDFFRYVGEDAQKNGIRFCIEPNPAVYECDFVTTSTEGLELVQTVNHPGFGLHLDAAGMTLSQEPIEKALKAAQGSICHFHASEPNLGAVGAGAASSVDHKTFADTLRQLHYSNWVSIEMRAAEQNNRPAVEKAIRFVQTTYA